MQMDWSVILKRSVRCLGSRLWRRVRYERCQRHLPPVGIRTGRLARPVQFTVRCRTSHSHGRHQLPGKRNFADWMVFFFFFNNLISFRDFNALLGLSMTLCSSFAGWGVHNCNPGEVLIDIFWIQTNVATKFKMHNLILVLNGDGWSAVHRDRNNLHREPVALWRQRRLHRHGLLVRPSPRLWRLFRRESHSLWRTTRARICSTVVHISNR